MAVAERIRHAIMSPAHCTDVYRDHCNGIQSWGKHQEWRLKPRLKTAFPALMRSRAAGTREAAGKASRASAIIDNLSAGGLYLRAHKTMTAGNQVLIVFRMTAGICTGSPGDVTALCVSGRRECEAVASAPSPRVAVRGHVVRVEELGDGLWGIAVKFQQHRFL
jgi:hypothetical protein